MCREATNLRRKMKLGKFGGQHEPSLDVIVGWLEAIVADEESECEKSSSKHRTARFEAAQSALQTLYDVSEWTSKLTKASK